MNATVPVKKTQDPSRFKFVLVVLFALFSFIFGVILGPQVQKVFANSDPLACPTPPAPFTLIGNVIIENQLGSQYLLCGWVGGEQSPLP